jgi:hypothetical protein
MGALLEMIKDLQSPVGILVLLVIIGAGYMYYRWMSNEPKEPEKGPESK